MGANAKGWNKRWSQDEVDKAARAYHETGSPKEGYRAIRPKASESAISQGGYRVFTSRRVATAMALLRADDVPAVSKPDVSDNEAVRRYALEHLMASLSSDKLAPGERARIAAALLGALPKPKESKGRDKAERVPDMALRGLDL